MIPVDLATTDPPQWLVDFLDGISLWDAVTWLFVLITAIAEVPVTVSWAQLQQIADAAAKGAEEGGAAGAKAAISGLPFGVTAA